MLDQFNPICHSYTLDGVDVVVDDHCGYKCIVALMGKVKGHDLLSDMICLKNLVNSVMNMQF